MSLSRRNFLRYAMYSVGGLSAAALSGTVYTNRIEPFAVQIRHLDIPVRRLPAAFDGYRLAQISDLHMGGWMTLEHMRNIAAQVNALNADAVAITGDFVTHILRSTLDEIVEALSTLEAPDGVFAVLGNHDHWTNASSVADAVRTAGVNLLLNTHTVLERGEKGSDKLVIAGVDDIWERQHDLDTALQDAPNDSAVVLLAHEPDYADEVAADGRVALQLSGHSHGGQVRIPLRGAVILPYLGQKYDLGHYTIGDLQLYVNPGVGMLDVPFRLGCPPEITVFTLRTQV